MIKAIKKKEKNMHEKALITKRHFIHLVFLPSDYEIYKEGCFLQKKILISKMSMFFLFGLQVKCEYYKNRAS